MENNDFSKKIVEFLRVVENGSRICRTPFLTLDEQEIVKGRIKNYEVEFYGGFLQAERQRALILPTYCFEEKNPCIDVIKGTYSSSFGKIKHSDVLGAIMNLGVKREMIGDIVVVDTTIYIACASTITSLLLSELHQINKWYLQFELCQEDVTVKHEFIQMEIVIPSRRLDAIVSHLCGINREEAKVKIINKEVKVNGEEICKIDKIVTDHSILSVRRYGRYKIGEQIGTTKKGNIVLKVEKYA